MGQPLADRPAPDLKARVILVGAVLAGAWLRLHHLGGRELSADEGATWAAACSASRVLPTPPGPVSVTNRTPGRSRRPASSAP